MSGVLTEDNMTGEKYVTHVTIIEETMEAKQPEVKQSDAQCTTQGTASHVVLSLYFFTMNQMSDPRLPSLMHIRHR